MPSVLPVVQPQYLKMFQYFQLELLHPYHDIVGEVNMIMTEIKIYC